MPKIDHVVEVLVPRNKLFEISTDFENYPKILPNFKTVKILSKDNNVVITEDEISIMNHFSIQKAKHTLEKPHKHTVEILSGEAQGSNIEQIFEETQNGTKVIIKADFKLKGKLKLISFAIKNKFKLGLESAIYEFADYIEANKN